MRIWSRARKTWVAAGALVAVVIIVVGVVLVVRGDRVPPASPAAPSGTAAVSAPPPTSATTAVTVFFHRGTAGDPTEVVPVRRVVAKTPRVATAAITQLLGGTTAREAAAGYWSVFVPATANSLRSVRIANGVARVDFRDFSRIIPNASSSFGSAALMAELDGTLEQFSSVRSTVYSFDGNVDAFYLWLQLTPPTADQGTPPQAIRAARDFLTDVVGMDDPVEGPFRRTGQGTADATFHPRSPTGHEPLLAHLLIAVVGPGGRIELQPFGVYHD